MFETVSITAVASEKIVRRRTIENMIDRGELQVSYQEFSQLLFFGCGLSLGDKRSRFEHCSFRDIRTFKCSVGWPIFYRCRFEDIIAKDILALLHGAAFVECTVIGKVQNINIALNLHDLAYPPVNRGARNLPGLPSDDLREQIKEENLALLSQANFSLDFRKAALDDARLIGEKIIPYLRFRRGQALIWKGQDLQEKVIQLGRATTNRSWSDFLLGNAPPDPTDRSAIAIIPETVKDSLSELENELTHAGIDVQHFDEA